MNAARRSLLFAGAGLVGGCGFQLRRAPVFAFRSIYVAATSALATELKRTLTALANVEVLVDAQDLQRADVVLDLLADQREKTVVGLNTAGQVREFQLRTRVKFRLRTRTGNELIPETELVQQRDITFIESAALAKEQEEALLYRSMQTEIIEQLLRRVAAVKTIGPA